MENNNNCIHNYILEKEFDTEELETHYDVFGYNSQSIILKKHVLVYKCTKCGDLKIIK